MTKRGFIPIIFGSLYLLTACQKSYIEDINDDDEPPPGEAWVVMHKQVQHFDTVIGLPLHIRAGYFYDTSSRTIIYRDTALYDGIPDAFARETIHTYDEQGRIINVRRTGEGIVSAEASLFYNADGLLQKVNEGHEINFTWNQEGSELVGHSTDAVANGGPYSAGNKIYALNGAWKLMTKVHLSNDTAYGDSYDEVVRNDKGNVVQRKLYEKKNNLIDQYDSIVYNRDETQAPRLSRFYELLGKGIEWYSGNNGIRFIEPPSFYSEYYEFENNLCNKITYYDTYIDVDGEWATRKYAEKEFRTEYDNNGNPVRQTVLVDGVKLWEITLRWEKIKWLF